jgi:surface antigen
MRNILLALAAISMTAAFPVAPACADGGEIIGTGLGAAFGGLFGSQFGRGGGQIAATSAGILAGGLIGNSIGHSIDEAPTYTYSSGGYAGSTSNEPIAFNAYTPNYVAPAAPPPTYVNDQAGTYCREFSQQILIQGHVQESYGIACLQPDGTWRIAQ